MKKILLLLFTASAISVAGQTYDPLLGDTTEWNIGWNVFSVIHPRSFHIVEGNHRAYGDTVINALNYKFFEQEFSPSFGYIREDTSTQKVWFREDGSTPELLLYDFSLNPGDSVSLTFPNYVSGDPYPSGWYYVDSVITRTIIAGPRKFYYLSNPASPINVWDNNNRYYLVWIEGAGSNLHPAYIYIEEYGSPQAGPFSMGCPAFVHLTLVCSHKDGVQQYFDTCFWNNFLMYAQDSCHYSFPGGINEQQNFSSLIFSPNPAANELRIQNLPANRNGLTHWQAGAEFKIDVVEIYNVLGERVFPSPLAPLSFRRGAGGEVTLNVSLLSPGIYFVRVTGDKTNLAGKFVKE